MDISTVTATNMNAQDLILSLTMSPDELVIKGTSQPINESLAYNSSLSNDNKDVRLKMKGWIYLEEIIDDINVIVPNKVVEITFCDGNKEKMICHKNDTFDLRKCCFIAIAKHLYKEEYTFEGIEYMAERLMYQKKYVKIVSDALKDYRRKEAEKEKELREEEEAKIIRDRQRLKRRKKKEERAQRHREILVDLIADSINEAKVRRKDNK